MGKGRIVASAASGALSEVLQPPRQECGLSATARLSQSQFNAQPEKLGMAKIQDRKGNLVLHLPRPGTCHPQQEREHLGCCVFN